MAESEFIEWWLCKNRFHLIEFEELETMVQTKQLFQKSVVNYCQEMALHLIFNCDMCGKDAHTKQGIIISERIKSLEEKPLDISRKLNIISCIL